MCYNINVINKRLQHNKKTKGRKDMKESKTIIYKENGIFKTTTQENYNATIRNASKVTNWGAFDTAEEIINYCIKYCNRKKEDFIIKE